MPKEKILNTILYIVGMSIIIFFMLLAIILSISWYKTMQEFKTFELNEFNKNNYKNLIIKFIKMYLSNIFQITAQLLII